MPPSSNASVATLEWGNKYVYVNECEFVAIVVIVLMHDCGVLYEEQYFFLFINSKLWTRSFKLLWLNT